MVAFRRQIPFTAMHRTHVSVRLFFRTGDTGNSAEPNPDLRIDMRIYINTRYRYIKTDQRVFN
jgi:hypothetical protein